MDAEAVRRLARAAALDLDGAEVARLANELNGILEQLDAVRRVAEDSIAMDGVAIGKGTGGDSDTVGDAGNAVPSAGVILRDDVPGADALHGTISRYAPEARDGFFLVPLVPTHVTRPESNA